MVNIQDSLGIRITDSIDAFMVDSHYFESKPGKIKSVPPPIDASSNPHAYYSQLAEDLEIPEDIIQGYEKLKYKTE
jgi:hypothetical protein